MSKGTPLPKVPQQNGGGLLDFITKPAEDVVNAIKGGANDVLQAGLQQKLIPGLGNMSPTLGSIGGNDIVKGFTDPNAGIDPNTGEVRAGASLPFMVGAMFGAQKPADNAEGSLASDVTTGGKTAEEIQAAKAAGMPRIIKNQKPTSATLPNFANDNMPSTQLNPNAEKLPPQPQVNQVVTKSTKPFPDISDEPEDVSSQRSNKNPITNGNPVRVDLRSEAGKNPYYLEDQNRAQAIIDKYVPGNTPAEVESNLPLKLSEESKRIQNIIGSDPKRISIQSLIDQNEQSLKNAGYTPGVSTKADNATRGLLNEFDAQIGNQATVQGKTAASGTDLMNYKKILDKRLQSVYKKIDNATTLTPEDTAALTLRKTMNDNFKALYPAAGDALDRQSAMIDARTSIANAAGKQEKEQITQANVPQTSKIGKIAKGVLRTGELGLAGAAAAKYLGFDPTRVINSGITGAEGFFNKGNNSISQTGKTNNNPQIQNDPKYYANQAHITSSSIPRTQADVKPDAYGNWPIANPQNIVDSNNTPLGMSLADYTKQNNDLGLKVKQDQALGLTGTPQYAADQQALDTLTTRWNQQGDIQNNYTRASTVSSLAAKIKAEVSGLPDNLLTSTTFDNLSSINNGQYRGLKQDIQNLASAFGTDPKNIWQQQNSQALQGTLDAIGQQNAYLWNQYVNYRTGNTGTSNLSPQAVPTITPQSPMPSMPQQKIQPYQFDSGSMSPQQAMQQANQIMQSMPRIQ